MNLIRPRVPGRKQRDLTDCAAACLSSVAGYYGLRLPIARIRQLAGTDQRGTTVLGLVEAAERMGLSAKGVRAAPASLPALPTPAIAHIVDGGLNHFVVLCRVRPRSVSVMDPRDGRLTSLELESFLRLWTGVVVLLLPAESFEPSGETVGRAVRFWRLMRPHRTHFLEAVAGAAAYALLGLSSAIFVQKVVDHVLAGGNRNLLNLLGVAMLLLLLVQLIIGIGKDVITLRIGQRVDAALVMGYYRHLLRLPQKFFDTMRVGEIISRVGDAVKIRAFLNDASLDLLVNLLILLLAGILMALYSWRLALLVVAILPLFGVTYWVTNRLNRSSQRAVMERAAELESALVETVTAAATIRRFGVEGQVVLGTERRFVRLLRGVYESGRTQIYSSNSTETISRLITIVVLWVGAGFVIDRSLSPGGLMSFYALAGFMTGPAGRIVAMNRTLQDALIAADRLFEILDLEREESAEERVRLEPGMLGDIHFESIGFRYGARGKVFDGLDLTIPLGQVTGIVGESGCGKSTLAGLLQKLHAPTSGRIRIGKYDLRAVDTADLRRLVACVPQEVHLFAGSIAANIALGQTDPDLRRIIDISDELGLTPFIEQLPGGFDAQVGENGINLSGGQRQRLAIARALYRNPAILVLDEATSSLDASAEELVQTVMRAYRDRGGTVVMIAHRLTTVCGADSILVLGAGRLQESGQHASLLARGGIYYGLWTRQYRMAETAMVEMATAGNVDG